MKNVLNAATIRCIIGHINPAQAMSLKIRYIAASNAAMDGGTGMMLKVRCPKCKHNMNYLPQPGMLTTKSKRCVYCGHTFKIHSNQMKSRNVKVGK